MNTHPSGLHHSGKKRRKSKDQKIKLYSEILLFILLPWVLLPLAKIIGASVYSAFAGVLAIISITMVKLTRFKPLIFISVFSILILLMNVIWRWTEIYMIPVITTEIGKNFDLFLKGILDGLINILLVMIYQRQLTHLRMKINYDWYASKTYRKFVRIVVYFLFFLILFWIFAFALHRFFHNAGYESANLTISAAVMAFIVPGTLAVLYLIKPTARRSSGHRHHRHVHRPAGSAASETL